MNKKHFILLSILALFFLSRLYALDKNPSGLYWDEASIGYNAFSVLKFGIDEWGKSFPLHFRAFGEFKLPVYIYIVSLFESFLGVNIWSVRLPAILFGGLSIWGTYLLAKSIFDKDNLALMSAFFMSVIPWYFLISRVGYEANAGLCFFIFGFYYLLKNSKFNSLVSGILLVLSMYSYNSYRIIVPLFVLSYIFLNRSFKTRFMSYLLILFIIGIGYVPVFRLLTSSDGSARFNSVGIPTNNIVIFSKTFLENIFLNISPNFLFISGDSNLRSQVSGFGELYLILAPFLVLGLIKAVVDFKKYAILLILILISLIPASITKESPHALRDINMIPLVSMFSAVGFFYVLSSFKKYFKPILIILVMLVIIEFIDLNYVFLNSYSSKSSADWQYGYNQLFQGEVIDDHKAVYITDEYAQPYIFELYYRKIDPNYFLKNSDLNSVDKWGFSKISRFGSIHFLSDEQIAKLLPKGELVTSKPLQLNPIRTIYNLDNSVSLYIYEN